jgi:hypothetical protein
LVDKDNDKFLEIKLSKITGNKDAHIPMVRGTLSSSERLAMKLIKSFSDL